MTLTLNFKIRNLLYLSQKWSDCHETKSKLYRLNSRPQMWPSGLGHDLDLEFSRSNVEFAISQPKMVELPGNKKQTYRLNSRPQMWPSGLTLAVTLTLNFQVQIWNLLYLSQKWSDCQQTKSKHIDETLGLKCDHRVWPCPWPCPWIFKVKYRICYISAKNGPIAMKRKANISIELRPQMWPSDLTLAMTLTFNFQGQIWNLLYLNQKWSDCHETKSKHIDWTPGLKCDQWVRPWPWPWPLNFQGQMWPWPLTTHMTLSMDFHGQI